jgi:hypothetical protein
MFQVKLNCSFHSEVDSEDDSNISGFMITYVVLWPLSSAKVKNGGTVLPLLPFLQWDSA